MLILLLPILSLLAGESARDDKATAELGKCLSSLQKKYPLTSAVEVIVIRKDVQAWTSFDRIADPIYIKDSGRKENEKALKHEWRHRWDRQQGNGMTEKSAREAEAEKL